MASPFSPGPSQVWAGSPRSDRESRRCGAWPSDPELPSPECISSLEFPLGTGPAAPSRANMSLDEVSPLRPGPLPPWPLLPSPALAPRPCCVSLHLSGVSFQEWGRAGCHEASVGCYSLVGTAAGAQAGGHQEGIPRRSLFLLRNLPTWYVHSSVGLSVCPPIRPPWLACQ